MIQIDGLSLPVLREQMRAGRMPGLDRMVRHGEATLDPWYALLPPVTPVSQAGILHGNNDEMPGFRWFEKRSKALIVANTPDGASEILRRRSDGRGLLADDGASIGNLVTGDAARTYLTMATISEDLPSAADPKVRGVFVRQVNYIRLLVLTLGEVAKELYQRERQRARGVEPRIHRDLHYALERALTNVSLRNLTTALVIGEMFDGAPAIYVDYTGYDALAHHVGPERAEAVDALDGLDRTIGSLRRVAAETHRPYRLVVLSDHGQCLGAPFSERYGERLEDVAKRLIGDTSGRPTLRQAWEYHGTSGLILGEIGRGPGVRSAIARRAARRRTRAGRRRGGRSRRLRVGQSRAALPDLLRRPGIARGDRAPLPGPPPGAPGASGRRDRRGPLRAPRGCRARPSGRALPRVGSCRRPRPGCPVRTARGREPASRRRILQYGRSHRDRAV